MIINYNDAYEYCAKVINERELLNIIYTQFYL